MPPPEILFSLYKGRDSASALLKPPEDSNVYPGYRTTAVEGKVPDIESRYQGFVPIAFTRYWTSSKR